MIKPGRTYSSIPKPAIPKLWLAVLVCSGVVLAMAEQLLVRAGENRLEFSAPAVRFLEGRPLARLHNAAPVPFDFQVTIFSGTRTHEFKKYAARFVISYDLWEESFKVTKLGDPVRSMSHLTARAAEAWCLQEMALDVSGLPPNDLVWAHMEIRALDDEESSKLFGRDKITDSGISLNGLVELFSRPPRATQSRWTLESAPATWTELRRRGA